MSLTTTILPAPRQQQQQLFEARRRRQMLSRTTSSALIAELRPLRRFLPHRSVSLAGSPLRRGAAPWLLLLLHIAEPRRKAAAMRNNAEPRCCAAAQNRSVAPCPCTTALSKGAEPRQQQQKQQFGADQWWGSFVASPHPPDARPCDLVGAHISELRPLRRLADVSPTGRLC
jgi:hypothetical protein